jgi:chromosome partitioning protein
MPLERIMRRLGNQFRLLPGHPDLSKIDALLGATPGVASTLKRGLETALAWDDAPILIDCAPALGVLSLNALFAADRVLIPVTADYLAIQGLNRSIWPSTCWKARSSAASSGAWC